MSDEGDTRQHDIPVEGTWRVTEDSSRALVPVGHTAVVPRGETLPVPWSPPRPAPDIVDGDFREVAQSTTDVDDYSVYWSNGPVPEPALSGGGYNGSGSSPRSLANESNRPARGVGCGPRAIAAIVVGAIVLALDLWLGAQGGLSSAPQQPATPIQLLQGAP